MEDKVLQQSKSWDDYINNKLQIDKYEIYKEGFPRYVFYGNDSLIKFKLILGNGDVIDKAYVDLSQQYMADGKQWRNVSNNDVIYGHKVVAWKEI